MLSQDMNQGENGNNSNKGDGNKDNKDNTGNKGNKVVCCQGMSNCCSQTEEMNCWLGMSWW